MQNVPFVGSVSRVRHSRLAGSEGSPLLLSFPTEVDLKGPPIDTALIGTLRIPEGSSLRRRLWKWLWRAEGAVLVARSSPSPVPSRRDPSDLHIALLPSSHAESTLCWFRPSVRCVIPAWLDLKGPSMTHRIKWQVLERSYICRGFVSGDPSDLDIALAEHPMSVPSQVRYSRLAPP